MRKYKSRDDTINGKDMQKVYICDIIAGHSSKTAAEAFVKIDNGQMGGTHWTYLYLKKNKAYYFNSFGGYLYKSILKQLTKPRSFQNYYLQDKNSTKCGTYCFYFFYLIGRMNYHNAVLKI